MALLEFYAVIFQVISLLTFVELKIVAYVYYFFNKFVQVISYVPSLVPIVLEKVSLRRS